MVSARVQMSRWNSKAPSAGLKGRYEALEFWRNIEWDVAVLDYSMPGRSGMELLEALKREHSDCPILMLSVFPERGMPFRSSRLGVTVI